MFGSTAELGWQGFHEDMDILNVNYVCYCIVLIIIILVAPMLATLLHVLMEVS